MTESTITTPDTGLRAGYDSFVVGGVQVPCYYAAPAGQENLPVVVVVHEIFGLHAYIADICRRLARQGYLAVAPELYVRQGDASRYSDMAQLMSELVTRVPHDQIMADLDGMIDWALAHGGDASRVGMTGFCWGGRITWLYCAHSARARAGVAWYGRLVGVRNALSPVHPVDVAAALHAPVLGLYGGQDAGIPLPMVEEMQQALAAASAQGHTAAARSTFHIYSDAPHAFHADYRPNYRPVEAADGFARMLTWFAEHGVK